VVLEDAEEAVQPDIHARWLNHGGLERFDLYPASLDFGLNIAITN